MEIRLYGKSYNLGYNAGVAAGRGSLNVQLAYASSTFGVSGSLPGTIIPGRTLGKDGIVLAMSFIDDPNHGTQGVNINGGNSILDDARNIGGQHLRIKANRVASNTAFSVTNEYTAGERSMFIMVFYIC